METSTTTRIGEAASAAADAVKDQAANATDRIAVRLFQLDWIPNRFEASWEKRTARIGFGLVFKSGKS